MAPGIQVPVRPIVNQTLWRDLTNGFFVMETTEVRQMQTPPGQRRHAHQLEAFGVDRTGRHVQDANPASNLVGFKMLGAEQQLQPLPEGCEIHFEQTGLELDEKVLHEQQRMDLTCAVHWARDIRVPATGTEVFAVVSAAFPCALDVDLNPAPQEFQVPLEGSKRDLQLPQESLPWDDLLDLQHLLNPQYPFRLAHRTAHYIPSLYSVGSGHCHFTFVRFAGARRRRTANRNGHEGPQTVGQNRSGGYQA